MNICPIQVIRDSISDLVGSLNKTRNIRLLFYLQKILIETEFGLFSIGQRVSIENRKILQQRFVHC